MKSNLFLRVIIGLFLFLWTCPLHAQNVAEEEAKEWVVTQGQKLLNVFGEPNLVKKYTELDEMMVQSIDLDYVAKFVMGKYWRQMDDSQKQMYQNIFKRYALSIYKSFPLDFETNHINFEITKVVPEDKKTTVKAKINLQPPSPDKTSPINDIFVDFILHKQDEKIKIIDLKLGESSLILSYRSRFYEMIAQDDDDIVWFLEDLSDITEAAERTNRQKLEQAEY